MITELFAPRIVYFGMHCNSLLLDFLSQRGLKVNTAGEDELIVNAKSDKPDLFILDYSPCRDISSVLTLINRLKRFDDRSYIVLIADFKNGSDIIRAFDTGVDDCINAVYDPEVLLCRLKSLLAKRPNGIRRLKPFYELPGAELDTYGGILTLRDTHYAIGVREAYVLGCLCEYEGISVPYGVLMNIIDNFGHRQRLVLDKIIKRFNSLFSGNTANISNIRGYGYMLKKAPK